jgi:polyketide biosynthesis acyl carrier protein
MDKAQNRARIVEVIRGNIIKNIEEINEEDIDLSKSMKDYGANSLDIIEVVSCSMRELNLKIPRSELTEIKSIDELADKFLQYME